MRKTFAALIAAVALTFAGAAFARPACRPGIAKAAPKGERCRNMSSGKFARCGSKGAVPAGEYVRKCTREGKPCRPTRAKAKKGAYAQVVTTTTTSDAR